MDLDGLILRLALSRDVKTSWMVVRCSSNMEEKRMISLMYTRQRFQCKPERMISIIFWKWAGASVGI